MEKEIDVDYSSIIFVVVVIVVAVITVILLKTRKSNPTTEGDSGSGENVNPPTDPKQNQEPKNPEQGNQEQENKDQESSKVGYIQIKQTKTTKGAYFHTTFSYCVEM